MTDFVFLSSIVRRGQLATFIYSVCSQGVIFLTFIAVGVHLIICNPGYICNSLFFFGFSFIHISDAIFLVERLNASFLQRKVGVRA